MQTIFEERFTQNQLPQGWYTDTFFPNYANGVWNCKTGDGVIIPLPHDAWSTLRLEVELIDIGDNATAFAGSDARTALSVDMSNKPSARHTAYDGGRILAQSAAQISLGENAIALTFEWSSESMQVRLGERVLLRSSNLRNSARAGSFHAAFRDCIVRRVAAYGERDENVEPVTPQAIEEGYPLEVTVDFNDDLISAAWTHETFDNLYKELKSWGTKTVSWIDLGRLEDDYFAHAPYNTGQHGLETFRNVGDIFTAAADHAHKHCIEFIGILKPYDMAIQGLSVPERLDPEGRGIKRIGGSTLWTTRMAAENQHLLMARKPTVHGPARNEVWNRIDLVKDDDAPAEISPAHVSFIVSEDNEHFRTYHGPVKASETVEEYAIYESTPSGLRPTGQKRRSRVLRFENLEISEPFMAIVVEGNARSFANKLCDLVHLFGENGEETHFTYGLAPRNAGHASKFEIGVNAVASERVGPQGGFEFNRYPGSPSGYMTSGGTPLTLPLFLDRGPNSYIAIARGKDRSPLAVMSPSFPETRRLWMTWVEAMLDSGADGIDIRPGHHHSDFAWIEYGFEEPVREEMLRRTGVDIWETDDFDHHQWRTIRGEGWTQFIREASEIVRARGKKLIVHIDGHFDGAPATGGSMNMVSDWRTWITEGLCDRVTGKALWPNSSFAYEVLSLAHQHGVPVAFAPYCNNFFEADRTTMNHLGDSPVGCEIPVERLIAWGKQSGYDSFLFYECGSALRAEADGTVNFRPNAEALRDVLQKHFR